MFLNSEYNLNIIFQYSRPPLKHGPIALLEKENERFPDNEASSSTAQDIQVQSFMEETKRENEDLKQTIVGLENKISGFENTIAGLEDSIKTLISNFPKTNK